MDEEIMSAILDYTTVLYMVGYDKAIEIIGEMSPDNFVSYVDDIPNNFEPLKMVA